MKNKKKIYYTWEQFNYDIEVLAEVCRDCCEQNPKNIYGVPRGGLIVAVVLSYLLDIPLILQKSNISKETLIVDDISDSGNTLKKLLKSKKYLKVLTLWIEKFTKFIPNTWCREKNNNQWVIFPWEEKI